MWGIRFFYTGIDRADDMTALIERWQHEHARLREQAREGNAVPLARVCLLAPVARPSKIMAIGLNYADHIAESGMEKPGEQLWFAKMANTVNGPHDPVQVPRASSKLDYEVELVAVIGQGGRHIEADHAPSRVFGYCVGNDVSVRDWQMRTSQWVLGKSFDGHAPLGPWIVTADELDDPHRLYIRCSGQWRATAILQHAASGFQRVGPARPFEQGDDLARRRRRAMRDRRHRRDRKHRDRRMSAASMAPLSPTGGKPPCSD
ncbi:fumarylacetoacetate hydrolase family protein [Dyella ginsengisoli]|uniref:fumarylacetoacetate hydrolase family protein n=1 Tax=Dyella ginsengisoli TaxID=363848 RepID=UPI00034CE560|nr:fumarylacetoacetate hydrolase family protein [Dyella ginsengisoli]